jgi:hypothetical protein
MQHSPTANVKRNYTLYINRTSPYDTNLDLFIQYYRSPSIRDRSRSHLERIANDLINISTLP